MDKGETKSLDHMELTRGLTKHGPNTQNPISVFVKGKFATWLKGVPPVISTPGTGGNRFIIADSLVGAKLEALVDGSEYHCITPRDAEPRFWERQAEKVDPSVYILEPNKYLYVASGHVKIETHDLKSRSLVKIEKPTIAEIVEESILVHMWLDA